jgi:hypothetical protein
MDERAEIGARGHAWWATGWGPAGATAAPARPAQNAEKTLKKMSKEANKSFACNKNVQNEANRTRRFPVPPKSA